MDLEVFQFIGETVTKATEAFVQPAVSTLMFELQMLTLTGVTLYITLTGYAISTGAVESPFWTFLKQCMKIIIIAFFALTADGYIKGVMDAIDGLESGLSQTLSPTTSAGGTPLSIYQILDQSLNKGFQIAGKCFQKADSAGWHFGSALGWILAGFIVAISTIYVSVLGGTIIIVAKFSLAVMFALGPLFIVSLMFPVTARFFDNWFSQVINYVLTIVIMATVLAFAMKAYDAFMDKTDISGSGDINPIVVALQVCALSGILGWIILQAGSMASGLAGGLSMAAMDMRQLAAPVSGSLNAAKGAGSLINPKMTRRDMQSGLMTTASHASHLMSGNTLWNPAYRQYIKSNIGKNWGQATGGSVKQ